MKKKRILLILVALLFLVSCSPQAIEAAQTIEPRAATATSQIESEQPIPTVKPQLEALPEEKPTLQPTHTPTKIVPPFPFQPDVTPNYIGTSIAQSNEVIVFDNLKRLARVAQWGRGTISGVRFAPDGATFVVGSALGLTLYDMDNLEAPPAWKPFPESIYYDSLYFSQDGKRLLFVNSGDKQARDRDTGELVNPNGVDWLEPDATVQNYRDLSVKSDDGMFEFRSRFYYEYNEELFTEEAVIREVYDSNNKLLYALKDDIPYITYQDRVEPEGCDLGVFSPCGNALMALAMAPDRAEFSPSGDTFIVLYAVPSLWDSTAYSFLRAYDSADGSLIMSIGGREHPISDFAYTPDSKSIGVAYLDGSVQIWDIGADQARFGARHLNARAGGVAYTADSKYLVIQRPNEIEVRQTKDGSMIGRFDAVTFAVHPTENLVAIGDQDGMVRVRRIDDGKNILVFQAHTDMIYAIAFSPDGLYLATGGRDCDVKMWDAKTGKLLHYFEETRIDAYDLGSNSRIFSYFMKFVPETDTVIGFGSWGTAVAWDIDSGATKYVIQSSPMEYYNGMWTLKPHFPEFFGVDVAQNRFYINDIGYDLENGGIIEKEEPPLIPNGCAFTGPRSVDDKMIFTVGYDEHEGEICVLDASNKELIDTLVVADTQAEWLYLSPDGKQLLATTVTGVNFIFQIVP